MCNRIISTLLSHCYLLVLPLLFVACKKPSTTDTPESPFGDPIVTAKGQPVGSASRTTIGSAGGSLLSPDGQLTLTVPAGAVTANTEFSIQPITNTLKEGDTAYRLLPEGVTFSKPVQLTLGYSQADLDGTAEDLLVFFYQTDKGTWKYMPTALDKVQKKVTVATTHFSDWMVKGILTLHAAKPTLSAGQSSRMFILGVLNKNDTDDVLAPLVPVDQHAMSGVITKAGNWEVFPRRGIITPNATGSVSPDANYKAPDVIPQAEKVTIKAQVEGKVEIEDPTAPDKKRNFGKFLLLKEIQLLADEFMTVEMEGGGETILSDVSVVHANNAIAVGGNDPALAVSVRVNGNGTGNYPCGELTTPGTSFVNVSVQPSSSANRIYNSVYLKCGPPHIEQYSPGSVKITKWGAVGDVVEGEFSGTLYSENNTSGCPQYVQKNMKITFRARRMI